MSPEISTTDPNMPENPERREAFKKLLGLGIAMAGSASALTGCVAATLSAYQQDSELRKILDEDSEHYASVIRNNSDRDGFFARSYGVGNTEAEAMGDAAIRGRDMFNSNQVIVGRFGRLTAADIKVVRWSGNIGQLSDGRYVFSVIVNTPTDDTKQCRK